MTALEWLAFGLGLLYHGQRWSKDDHARRGEVGDGAARAARRGDTCARAAPPRFPSMYQLGLMILADECPPDSKFYMCRMGCAGEIDDVCADCWRHYLHYVASAGRSDPYRTDRQRDDI